jgi:hypothetical protein
MLLYRRAINLSSMMSVIFDLAMNAILQELGGDKVNENPPAISNRFTLVGVQLKTERQ